MPKPCSQDLRMRLIKAIESDASRLLTISCRSRAIFVSSANPIVRVCDVATGAMIL